MSDETWLQFKTVLKSCVKDSKQFYILVAEDKEKKTLYIPFYIIMSFTDSVEKSLQRMHPVLLEDPIKADSPSIQTEFDFTSKEN